MGLHLGTARSLMGSLRTSGSRVANMAGDEFTSAFGDIADVTGIVAGSARSRMTHNGHHASDTRYTEIMLDHPVVSNFGVVQ